MALNLQSSQLVAVFDGQNYEFWAARMKTTLLNRDLWEVVKDGVPEATTQSTETPDKGKDAALKALKAKDTAALQIIQHAVADVVFDKILSATSAHQAWKLLEHSYQGNEKVKTVRLQSLRREFENLKMKEGEKVKTYSDRIQAVANQMRALGEGKSNFDLVVKMLASMPKSYAGLSSLMEETKDLKTVSYAELLGSLEAHEKKFFPEDEEDAEGAFHTRFRSLNVEDKNKENSGQTSYRGKRWCGYCKRDNHNEDVCWIKSGKIRPDFNSFNRSRDTSSWSCFRCGKVGHLVKDCKAKFEEQAQITQEDNEAEESYHMFTARQEDQESPEENMWLIDSGCTNHMTSHEHLFTNLDFGFNVPILVGNGDVLTTKGKGDIEIMTMKGKRIIKDVLLVPKIAKNLLSVSQMIQNDYEVTFDHMGCTIFDPVGRKIAEVPMIKKSFHLKMSANEGATIAVAIENVESCCQEAGHTNVENQKNAEDKNKSVVCQPMKSGALAVKEKPVSDAKNQRRSELEREENKAREVQDVNQGSKVNKMVINRKAVEKIECSPRIEREQKWTREETCKKDAEKNQKIEKKNQESKHKGFGFQKMETISKSEVKNQTLRFQNQYKEEVRDLSLIGKSSAIKFGDIDFNSESLQKKTKVNSVGTEAEQNKIEEITAQKGAMKPKKRLTLDEEEEKRESKKAMTSEGATKIEEASPMEISDERNTMKLKVPVSYADALRRTPPVKFKFVQLKPKVSNFTVLKSNLGINRRDQEGVSKSIQGRGKRFISNWKIKRNQVWRH